MNVPLKRRNQIRKFHIRWNSHADLGVYYQVFIEKEYSLAGFAQGKWITRFYGSLIESKRRPVIFDAGANIGASAVWFGTEFPSSKLVAVEPAPGNCDLLHLNCRDLDCDLIRGGIGCEDGAMYLENPGFGDWGFRLVERGTERVAVFSANKLVEVYVAKALTPFIFKMDIEGGEQLLFEKDVEWVEKFPLIIIELHDYMLPSSASSRNFLRCISQYDFDLVFRGENAFCFNNEVLRQFH